MHNPLHVEERFQGLLLSLSYPSTTRQHLQELDAFLAFLGDEAPRYEAYVIECAQRLPSLLKDLARFGLDPGEMSPLLERLTTLRSTLPVIGTLPGFLSSLGKFRQVIAGLYCYACALKRAMAVLDARFAAVPPSWLPPESTAEVMDPLSLVRDAAHAAREAGDPAAGDLEAIAANWTPPPGDEAVTVLVPVVERPLQEAPPNRSGGGLRRVTIHVVELPGASADQLHSDVAVFGVDQAAVDLTSQSVSAARALLVDTHPLLLSRHFTGNMSFGERHGLHEGGSANLAIAALYYCAILRSSHQRLQYQLRPDAAITGDVATDGKALPVDRAGLALKIKAVFFSHVRSLVVPKGQLQDAETLVSALRETYPCRELNLIGVARLRDVFFDLRVIEQKKIPVSLHAASWLWRKKFRAGGITVILVLSLIIARLIYGPLDKNPVSADFKGQIMLLRNAHGELIEEVPVGNSTRVQVEGMISLIGLSLVTSFADVDGDGTNEIIYCRMGSPAAGEADLVCCRRVGADSLLWSVPLRHHFVFPHSPDIASDQFHFQSLMVADLFGTGKLQVLVLQTHQFFPCVLLMLDAATGQRIASYLHAGMLNPAMQVFDIDGDGRKEILLAGMNNAMRKDAVCVLDPRYVSGHSPATDRYTPEGLEPGLEKYYLLLPNSFLNALIVTDSFAGAVTNLRVSERDTLLTVIIDETNMKTDPRGYPLGAVLYYHIARDIRLRSISTGSEYDALAARLLREGKTSIVTDYKYFEHLKRQVQYWTGDGWSSEPTMNKRYLQARGERQADTLQTQIR